MKLVVLLVIALVSILTEVKAGNVSTTAEVKIDYITFYSKQESIYPSHKGVTQIRISGSIPWSDGANCSSSSVLVRNEDSHMISALSAAKTASIALRLYADDSLRIDSECYLRAISYL